MDTIKFCSFGNTPQPDPRFSSDISIQHSFRPKTTAKQQYITTTYTNIPQLKKQMQQAINFKKTNHNHPSTLKKYPSEISLMKSGISLISNTAPTTDLPLNLLQLQVICTEQLLALRQDKITYMQAHNKAIDARYKVQRQLSTLKKKQQKQRQTKSQINQLIQLDKQHSTNKKKFDKKQIITKNQKLKSELQLLSAETIPLLSDQQQQQQLISEIEIAQQNSRILQQKINKLQTTSRRQPIDSNLAPKASKSGKCSLSHNQIRYLRKLRQKRNSLHKSLAQLTQKFDIRAYFYSLIAQNKQLYQKLDQLDYGIKKASPLQQIKQQIQNEQDDKKIFFNDLMTFKQQFTLLKQQNLHFKMQLNNQIS